ncbi:MAG: SCO1664 family protein [Actinomycetia bacterium]|nr:SCO1664 family protein [Actinomycetes bacterium]MCH9706075.1 SCO1664 family protein [Actinomycetes bacterium]MCH9788024.1 SCO1664 family protein [Actinomycetes bacterium]MCH9796997.1 SCO1664 family protein [Actinomycetes bacterium]MCH9851843.1 SCO1664 family protein [Actinomycetes bacterium]
MDDAWAREIRERLAHDDLEVDGQLVSASNTTWRCSLGDSLKCVYKPQQGERPLWDFPDGTLSGREVAAHLLDRMLGYDLVPPTIWREDGPAGPGMCQLWVTEDPTQRLVDVVPTDRIPPGWHHVLNAEDGSGRPVALVHAEDERLRHMALLDAVINNGDRKGGHVITDDAGGVWAIDHGVSLASEPKLRTVLWGWAGELIHDADLTRLDQLAAILEGASPNAEAAASVVELAAFVNALELAALRSRVRALIETGRYPFPNDEWPAIPWPVF